MKTATGITIAAVLALGTIGAIYFFDIDQTREGKMPSVDVSVKSGTLPKFDVDAGSVEVGSKEVTVKVPEVTMVEKTVTVPTVEVEPAKE